MGLVVTSLVYAGFAIANIVVVIRLAEKLENIAVAIFLIGTAVIGLVVTYLVIAVLAIVGPVIENHAAKGLVIIGNAIVGLVSNAGLFINGLAIMGLIIIVLVIVGIIAISLAILGVGIWFLLLIGFDAITTAVAILIVKGLAIIDKSPVGLVKINLLQFGGVDAPQNFFVGLATVVLAISYHILAGGCN